MNQKMLIREIIQLCRIVRFIINKMKKIIVFLILLQLVMVLSGQEFTKDSEEDYSSITQYEANVDQVKAIYDFLQPFDKQKITRFFNEWISQNKTLDKPEVIIESENVAIYFSKFIPDELIVPIPSLTSIRARFNEFFEFKFENRSKYSQVEGNIQFSRSGNNSSSCKITFNFDCTISVVKFKILNMANHRNFENKEIKSEANLKLIPSEEKKLTQTKIDEKSCAGVNETQRRSTFEYVLQAMEIAVEERIKLATKSVLHSMSNKWLHPDKNSHNIKEKHYSRFKTECNTVTSPWMFDYNEVIINGLNNLNTALIEYLSDGKTNYSIVSIIIQQHKSAKIRWNFASVMKKEIIFDITNLKLKGTVNELMNDLEVQINGIVEIESNNYIKEVDEEIQKSLEILIADGIMQTIRKMKYDETTDFSNVMRKIVQPFDTNMHLFVDFEKVQETNSHIGRISFSGIGMEAFHLGNITWLQSNNSKIGTGKLIYKEIKGEANFLHPIKKDNISLATAPVSASVYIKEATFEISLEYYLNSTNEAPGVRINDNDFRNADTTITITSNNYRVRREERVDIGKLVSKYFVKTIREQLFKVEKSTFRPLFDICKNSLNTTTAKTGRSNHFNQERYFATIRDCWGNMTTCGSTRPVDMIVAGSWNFESINVQYNNKKVIITGIQLENVTANIKQFGDSNKTVEKNYSMNYFSLIINHTDRGIIVEIPTKVELNLVDSNSSNISSSQTTPDVMKQFESSVASFYTNSIYEYLAEDSNYRAKFRKFANEIITKTILEDAPSAYDASSLFISNIVQKLEEKKRPFFDFSKNEYNTYVSSNSDYISMTTKQRVDTRNATIFVGGAPARSSIDVPIMQEEICISNHSQDTHSIVEKLVIYGTVYIFNRKAGLMIDVPFTVTSKRSMNTSGNHYYNENEKIYIDDKNITDIFLEENETSNFEPNNEVMTTEIAFMASSFLRGRLKESSRIPNFCQTTFNSNHFFVISNTIDYPSQQFSRYHIKLYGLHNLKSLYMGFTSDITKFEITATNLTARIIWGYYLSDTVSQTPKIMNMQIWNISLCGIISDTERIIFTKQSELRFSDQENSTMMNKLKETIGPIILRTIQEFILKNHNEIHGN